MKKQYILVLDTETANNLDYPLPYDIGYAICDRKGNIQLTRSFVVADIFLDCKDLMQTAYYANKIPAYWEDIKQGKRKLKTFFNIRKQLLADMKTYNVKEVGAYNMGFDQKALNTDMRYISKSFARWFFPYGTKFFCIWNMACTSILNRKSYINFALENNLISDKGNILTSAESAYRYITKDKEFIESHTGLEDVIIEIEIMKYCLKQHKKLNKNINSQCWQVVQRKRKELGK